MEAEGTEFRTNAAVGDSIDIDVLLASNDAVVLAVRRDGVARPAGARPRARRHPPGDGVPAAGQPGAAGRHRGVADHGRGQARRHHRRRRHRRRLPRHGAPPGRGVGDAAGDHAPPARRPRRRATRGRSGASIFRTSSAHEEGGERVFSVNTERFVDDGDGNVKALLLHEVEMVDGRFHEDRGHRPRAARRLRAPGDGLRRAREGRRGSSSSASSFDERGNVAPRRPTS